MFYLGGRYLGRFSEPVQWEPGADAPAWRLKGFLLIFLSLWFSASPTVLQARPTLCLYLKLVTLKMPCRMDEMVSPQHIYTLPCFPVIAKDINSIIICLWYHKQKRCTHSYMGKLTLKSLTEIAGLGSFFSKATEEVHWSDVCKKDAICYAIQ